MMARKVENDGNRPIEWMLDIAFDAKNQCGNQNNAEANMLLGRILGYQPFSQL